jgi:hypothetical protein
VSKYQEALAELPPSGGGGCHRGLLRVSNIARLSGIPQEQCVADLQRAVHGSRPVSLQEIESAVSRGYNTECPPARKTPKIDTKATMNKILKRGAGWTQERWMAASPIKVDDQTRAWDLILRHLYKPDEWLYCGPAMGNRVMHAVQWWDRFNNGMTEPHIITNPLTGELGHTKNGIASMRSDQCVSQFRFAVVEFDEMPLQQQIEFYAGWAARIAVLVSSGGKSVHAWVRVDAKDRAEWEEKVEGALYGFLTPLGCDPTCRNEARLSRLPGHFREDKGQIQRLLYLNPNPTTGVQP